MQHIVQMKYTCTILTFKIEEEGNAICEHAASIPQYVVPIAQSGSEQ